MPRLVHFEIHAENMERAAKFYTEIFGWKLQKWDGPVDYMVVYTGDKAQPGIDGGMILRRGPAPVDGQAVNAYVCTMEIDDLDAYLGKVQKSGGTIAVPKMEMSGVGWLAYCKDTEGNIFGLMQAIAPAK